MCSSILVRAALMEELSTSRCPAEPVNDRRCGSFPADVQLGTRLPSAHSTGHHIRAALPGLTPAEAGAIPPTEPRLR